MIAKSELQSHLNQNRHRWGHSCRISVWEIDPTTVDQPAVIEAGIDHACRVICRVVNSDAPDYPKWLSYRLKQEGYLFFSQVLESSGRSDLLCDWGRGRQRHNNETTHPHLSGQIQVPGGINPHHIEAIARLPANYPSNLYRTLSLISHGLPNKIGVSVADKDKLIFIQDDFTSCALTAKDAQHFCCLVAVKTASILHQRGVDDRTIINLITSSFAIPDLVKEYGCRKEAIRIVDGIIVEFTRQGALPGFSRMFRQQARPLVRDPLLL